MRSRTASGEKPPNTTLCGAPMRAQASIDDHHLGDHRQVDADDVAACDAEFLQGVGEALDLGQQLGVGDVALLPLLAAPVEGDAIAPAREHMAIEAVVGHVELAVR